MGFSSVSTTAAPVVTGPAELQLSVPSTLGAALAGVAGISSTAPGFTGDPGEYFCSDPETRAALSDLHAHLLAVRVLLSIDRQRWRRCGLEPFDLDLLHEATGITEWFESPLLHLRAEVRRRQSTRPAFRCRGRSARRSRETSMWLRTETSVIGEAAHVSER